jgi:hypothetical protein
MGTTTTKQTCDLSTDMIFAKCENCSCVQLVNLIPLEILYKDSHAHSVGPTWQKHHKSFSEFVLKHAEGNIVEVGGAHLILAHHLEKSKKIEKITVYDTNIISTTDSHKIILREEFFNHKTITTKPDAIIHSHVIEHLYNPKEEIKDMSNLLEENGLMIISAPVIDKMMKDGFTNAMNFEHTYGLTKKLLRKILANANLEIIEEKDFNEHCVFVSAKKVTSPVEFDDSNEDASYLDMFIDYHNTEVSRINSLLKNPEKTFIFGAHVFSQFLLKYGLNEVDFSCVLDNDSKKQSQRLYGTNLTVKSPKILKNIDSPVVILKAGQYTEEIKQDIINNINSNTRFIL